MSAASLSLVLLLAASTFVVLVIAATPAIVILAVSGILAAPSAFALTAPATFITSLLLAAAVLVYAAALGRSASAILVACTSARLALARFAPASILGVLSIPPTAAFAAAVIVALDLRTRRLAATLAQPPASECQEGRGPVPPWPSNSRQTHTGFRTLLFTLNPTSGFPVPFR